MPVPAGSRPAGLLSVARQLSAPVSVFAIGVKRAFTAAVWRLQRCNASELDGLAVFCGVRQKLRRGREPLPATIATHPRAELKASSR
jgi:hypothetical protein